MGAPHVVRQHELTEAGQTPGMVRRAAFEEPGVWVGLARTEPGAVSGWHHHGDNTSYLYCVAGMVRVESGPAGRDVVEAGPGDFMVVPANTVHRESDPSGEGSLIVLTRLGTGPLVENVDGPDPG